MIYVEHDLFSNLISSSKSGDMVATKDILLNEVSDLVATKPKEVIELLKTVGVNIKESASKSKIVSEVIDNMAGNARLLKGISFMMADKHNLLKVENNSSIDGAEEKRLTAIVDNIAQSIEPAAAQMISESDRTDAKKLVKTNISAKTGEKIEDSNNTLLYLGIAVAVLAAAGGIYWYMKKNKNIANAS
jgi:LPXTG-motif cell wall-anchored protein